MHATELPSSAGVQWEWKRPSNWIFVLSIVRDIAALLRTRPILVTSIIAVILVTLYAYRYVWEPYVLFVPRKYAGAIIAILSVTVGSWFLLGWIARRFFPSWGILARVVRPIGVAFGIGIVFLAAAFGDAVHTYFAQAWRYQTLHVVEPDRYPTTDNERIWPLHGIYTYARQQMNETEAPSVPNLVRSGTRFDWTMAVEPSTSLLRFSDDVEEIVSIPSTVVTFDLRRGKNARFETGEKLLFSRNVYTCVRRRMWFWQAATYEPADNVVYLRNDGGAWVQVVPMIRWAGLIFPRPEFGGVVVIPESSKESSGSALGWFQAKIEGFLYGTLPRVFWGCGTWIGPDEIKDHPYLVGQNIVPFEVTRFMAASTRFRAGLAAPMPWRREGDVRIADLPDDVNQQPFTLYFNVWDKGTAVATKLFHYFALEPEAAANQGLATSMLAPADGIGPAYLYWHFGRSDSCMGVSAVSGWVRSSKRMYDWSVNRPVEHRPYLRDIPDGRGRTTTRWTWLTTIVTVDEAKLKAKDPGGFVTGTPEIAITDCRHKETVWVNRRRPELWPKELRESLSLYWDKEE